MLILLIPLWLTGCSKGSTVPAQGREAASPRGCGSTSHVPRPRGEAALQFDPTLGGLVLYGGLSTCAGRVAVLTDTWLFRTGQWRHLAEAGPSLTQPSLAYDSAERKLFLLGNEAIGERTWVLKQTMWTQVTSSGAQPAQSEFSFYDSVDQLVLSWQPQLGAQQSSLWSFNGHKWLKIPGSYGKFTAFSGTYDVRDRDVELYGSLGLDSRVYFVNIRRGIIGSARSPMPTIISPWSPLAAYDPDTGKTIVVLSGTPFAAGALSWTFDGVLWNRIFDPAETRTGDSLAFDSQLGPVLFGGYSYPNRRALNDLWRFSHAGWTRIASG